MKRFAPILLAVLSVFSITASAAELMFYERPAFMADTMPVKINCNQPASFVVNCKGDYKAPAFIMAKSIMSDGSNLQVVRIDPIVHVTCQNGMCAQNDNRAPVGELLVPADVYSVYRVEMIRGYYLHHDAKSGVWAYKRGFGPLADKYPPYAIYTEPTQYMSTVTDDNVYDVTCMPDSDTCDYQGNQVGRRELKNYIPTKTSEWCDNEFCYSNSSYDGVIGINPDGFL